MKVFIERQLATIVAAITLFTAVSSFGWNFHRLSVVEADNAVLHQQLEHTQADLQITARSLIAIQTDLNWIKQELTRTAGQLDRIEAGRGR